MQRGRGYYSVYTGWQLLKQKYSWERTELSWVELK